MLDWETVTTGCTEAVVRRSPDGRTYAKTAATSATLAELLDERDRLTWLATTPIDAPRVVDWQERDGVATLVTSTLPGVPASDLPAADARAAARGLVEFLELLHALPVGECPFDRRLGVTVGAAAENVAAGEVDEADFDEERRGWTAEALLGRLLADRERAQAGEAGDLVVCHGDFCLPNALVDPDTARVTGILDVGRLGVADRHLDAALLVRSMAAVELNPGYGPELAAWVAERLGADPWRIEFYCLLDEFL